MVFAGGTVSMRLLACPLSVLPLLLVLCLLLCDLPGAGIVSEESRERVPSPHTHDGGAATGILLHVGQELVDTPHWHVVVAVRWISGKLLA